MPIQENIIIQKQRTHHGNADYLKSFLLGETVPTPSEQNKYLYQIRKKELPLFLALISIHLPIL